MVKRCMECNRIRTKNGRRGLCRPCYRKVDVRDCHAPLPRGAWRNKWQEWSAHEVVKLQEMYKAGIRDEDIAAALGRGIWAVRKRRHRLGLVMSMEQSVARRKKKAEVPVEDSKRDISFIRHLRR